MTNIADRSSWIELSAVAFNHNIAQFRAFLPLQVKMAIVLKSNAYGHGLEQMGQLGQLNPYVDYMCVFFLSEALRLREQGVTKPILVLGWLDDQVEEAIEHDIELVCHDVSQLVAFNEAGRKLGKSIKVHLKIDTGMSRLGIFPSQVLSVAQQIKDDCPYVELHGVMTHYSESGSLDVEWTERQERLFAEAVQTLKNNGIVPTMLHASNTGATLRFPESQFGLVRLGGGTYGLPQRTYVYDKIKEAIPNFELKPVLTLKSQIMNIKELPAGNFVSYDRLYQTTQPKRVATVPIGYFDGYGRRKPAGLHVLINGVLAPVLGSVCMNLIIVDVSHIENVAVHDEVVAIGDHERIRVNDIAPLVNCVNYEVTTLLNPTIPRIVV